jgi:hypothetical protein
MLAPRAAVQTRIVSVARIRLDFQKSARSFKVIISADISEFESNMPSHAVSSVMAYGSVLAHRYGQKRELGDATITRGDLTSPGPLQKGVY